jgi:uncharacterized phage infection (PIP) family protein YhgE
MTARAAFSERGTFQPIKNKEGDSNKIKPSVHTTEIPKILKALKEWRSNLTQSIQSADETFQKNTFDDLESAFTQYTDIQNKLAGMIKKLSGKCYTYGLEEESEKIARKINEIQRILFRSLSNYSLKTEKGLALIGSICSLYCRCGAGAPNEQKTIERIQKQIHNSLAKLKHLTKPVASWYQLHPRWDQALIEATSTNGEYEGCPDFIIEEYTRLFRDHSDLRDGLVSLTDQGFEKLTGKIQGYLARFIKKNLKFGRLFYKEQPVFKFYEHTLITPDQIREWLQETSPDEWIQDIPEILKRKPSTVKL